MSPSLPECTASRTWLFRLLAGLLILGSAGVRIAFMSSTIALDLSPDEAHYWDWSRHLDWNYYSKGPLVALMIRGSCELTEGWTRDLPGQAMLSVRLPAVLCGSLLIVALYVLTTLALRRESLAFSVVVILLTLPPITAASEIMTTDSPYLCCWSWALVFGFLALFRDKTWGWPAAGLMVALGILAKHTMILFIPFLVLFALFTPGWRGLLLRPGFWILVLLGALGGLPIAWWNYQHDWVSLRHLGTHAHQGDGKIYLLGPLTYVGMQAGLLMVYWFVVWLRGMWAHHPGREPRADFRYLWWMSMPMFLFFMAFSLKNRGGEPNWPVAAYLSGIVLLVHWLAQQFVDPRAWYRRMSQIVAVGVLGLGLGLTIISHHTSVIYPLLASLTGPPTEFNSMPLRKMDPTCRLQGARTLAANIDKIRQEFRDRGEPEPIIAGDHSALPGLIAFYCQGRPTVYSLGPLVGDRHSQYDLWHPNPVDDVDAFRGRTFILVGRPDTELPEAFETVEPARAVRHYAAGHLINFWVVTVARNYRGAKVEIERY